MTTLPFGPNKSIKVAVTSTAQTVPLPGGSSGGTSLSVYSAGSSTASMTLGSISTMADAAFPSGTTSQDGLVIGSGTRLTIDCGQSSYASLVTEAGGAADVYLTRGNSGV